jgi:type IV secretory pathway VirB3-like protein
MLKKIWHDPVWSGVIAAAIFAGVSYFFGGWKIIKALFQYSINVPVWILTILFLLLVALLIIIQYYKKKVDEQYILHFVPLHSQRWWHLAKQQDESFCSQITLDVQVTNISLEPVRIVKISLIKPKAKILHAEASLPVRGTFYHSFEEPVPPRRTTTASIHIMVRGKIAPQGSPIRITLGITDQYGQEYKLKNIIIETRDKPIPKNIIKERIDSTLPKIPWTYNPEVDSITICEAILKEEKRNYEANGRIRGGLGSLNVGLQNEPNYGETKVGKVPSLLWKEGNRKNVSSPNLERLIKIYEALSNPDKDNLEQYLLSQLQKESPFAEVAYFVFLALHRIGRTIDALKTARTYLSGDKVFGYSNLLGTLSAVISHEHFAIEPSLYPQILNELEDDQEPNFRLKEKINLAILEQLDDGQ